MREICVREMKNDREFVLSAVTEDGPALKYASDEMKNDAVVLVAVAQNYRALDYASDNLRFPRRGGEKSVA